VQPNFRYFGASETPRRLPPAQHFPDRAASCTTSWSAATNSVAAVLWIECFAPSNFRTCARPRRVKSQESGPRARPRMVDPHRNAVNLLGPG
jgi:hypothetical protein